MRKLPITFRLSQLENSLLNPTMTLSFQRDTEDSDNNHPCFRSFPALLYFHVLFGMLCLSLISSHFNRPLSVTHNLHLKIAALVWKASKRYYDRGAVGIAEAVGQFKKETSLSFLPSSSGSLARSTSLSMWNSKML